MNHPIPTKLVKMEKDSNWLQDTTRKTIHDPQRTKEKGNPNMASAFLLVNLPMNNNGICCYSSFLCGISKYDAFSSLKVDLRRNILVNTKDLQSENAPQNAIEIKTIVIEKNK